MLGVWVIVLQNAGILPTNHDVIVLNEIDANVKGEVEAKVKGSVDIDNTVDINIRAINNQYDAFYDHGYDGVYNRIPVYMGN